MWWVKWVLCLNGSMVFDDPTTLKMMPKSLMVKMSFQMKVMIHKNLMIPKSLMIQRELQLEVLTSSENPK